MRRARALTALWQVCTQQPGGLAPPGLL